MTYTDEPQNQNNLPNFVYVPLEPPKIWAIEAWPQYLWACPVVFGTRVLAADAPGPEGWEVGSLLIRFVPASPTGVWSDLDMWSLGSKLTPWAFRHIPLAIPEPSLHCGRVTCHCHKKCCMVCNNGACRVVSIWMLGPNPAEHLIVTGRSMLFSSPVSSINDTIYWCKSKWGKRRETGKRWQKVSELSCYIETLPETLWVHPFLVALKLTYTRHLCSLPRVKFKQMMQGQKLLSFLPDS